MDDNPSQQATTPRGHWLPLIAVALMIIGPLAAIAWFSAIWQKSASTLVVRFEDNPVGKPSKLFTTETGQWIVTQDTNNRVLFQSAHSDDDTFNLALLDVKFADVDLSVWLKAVAGDLDRGGGLVWRAIDKNNYYIARYNPLENNFRVYKVKDGKRTQFQSANTPGDTKWHKLRVTMAGTKITCYLDGVKHLEADDPTFPNPGKVGLWSKADAQTYFDDLELSRF